jgi:hypothetical protein
MAMTFSQLFGTYYTLYRGEATPPAVTDDEWPIAVRLYNNAVNRMVAFDDTKWNFLYSTLQTSTQVSPVLVRTLTASTTTYTAPTDMAEPGGILAYVDASGNRTTYPIVQPYEVQNMPTLSHYGYFTGDQEAGFVLHINPAPSTAEVGMSIDYIYYKKITPLIASTADGTVETGTSVIAGGDPAFYYNHMLANRFRPDENYSAYQTALRDAEEALKGMKLKNNSGSQYTAWGVQDSGFGFGDTDVRSGTFGD